MRNPLMIHCHRLRSEDETRIRILTASTCVFYHDVASSLWPPSACFFVVVVFVTSFLCFCPAGCFAGRITSSPACWHRPFGAASSSLLLPQEPLPSARGGRLKDARPPPGDVLGDWLFWILNRWDEHSASVALLIKEEFKAGRRIKALVI